MLQIVIYKKLNFWEEYTPLTECQLGIVTSTRQLTYNLLKCVLQNFFFAQELAKGSGQHQTFTFWRPVFSVLWGLATHPAHHLRRF